MINSIEELDRKFTKPTAGGNTKALKYYVGRSGNTTYTLMGYRSNSKEKIKNEVAEEFIEKFRGKITELHWNSIDTSVYIRVK